MPDSLASGSRNFRFIIENDSLYQHLEVARYDPACIWFDLAVCIKGATWTEDTLRADGILFWSGSYGPVVEGEKGPLLLPVEWCFSGYQIEVCLHGNDVGEATISWLAPSSTRMRRK